MKSKRAKIIFLLLFSAICLLFVNNNYDFYKQTIAKINKVSIKSSELNTNPLGINENIYVQSIEAIVKNGINKGKIIYLENETSTSNIYDNYYKVGDEVFVSINKIQNNKITGIINDVKRDKYITLAVLIFICLSILVAGKKGLYSVFSLVFNVILFSFVLDLYLNGANLIIVTFLSSIIFSIISLFLVSGKNKKTIAAIVSTVICVLISVLISLLAIYLTNGKGIRYEEMQFLTKPPYEILIAEIIIGSLGAIMDISIAISSSINELLEKNTNFTKEELLKSGKKIGLDIMGPMTHVLFFAYVSGTIPMLILWLRNGVLVSYAFSVNWSLELIRALTGSIGIVIAIPISIYITVNLLKKKGDNR